MELILDFICNHWLLTSIFVGLLILYTLVELFYKDAITKISVQQAISQMNHHHAIALDIRPKELFEAGHILGAINLPAAEISSNWKKIQKHLKHPIIVIGQNNKEITMVIKWLKQQNFVEVLQLSGGMQEWLSNSLPTTSGTH